jgi:hypothetical protein
MDEWIGTGINHKKESSERKEKKWAKKKNTLNKGPFYPVHACSTPPPPPTN